MIRDQREDVFAGLTAGGATELAARAHRPDFVTHGPLRTVGRPAPGHHRDCVLPCSNPSVSPVESKRSPRTVAVAQKPRESGASISRGTTVTMWPPNSAALWASASGRVQIWPDLPTVPRETRNRIFVRHPQRVAGVRLQPQHVPAPAWMRVSPRRKRFMGVDGRLLLPAVGGRSKAVSSVSASSRTTPIASPTRSEKQ